ncbi:MAG TPA: hypothetical protein VMX55_00400 [candidate division Zixibacteria bacterium]|nr:hypothetical protein [candidate division Zixibacteria bacterium]
MSASIGGKTTTQRSKEDICIHMSEGIQNIIPPNIIEKLLFLITNYFESDYTTIFIMNTVNKIYQEDNILYLPSSEVDKLFFFNVVATKILTEDRNKKIIHVRLAIEN